MKLIFLDIDGVLATAENALMPKHPEFSFPFDSDCVTILNKIIDHTSAEIIFTSDWRVYFGMDLQRLDQLFKYNKVIKSPIDFTPNLFRKRYKEILNYIHKHNRSITSFVILDDMDL